MWNGVTFVVQNFRYYHYCIICVILDDVLKKLLIYRILIRKRRISPDSPIVAIRFPYRAHRTDAERRGPQLRRSSRLRLMTVASATPQPVTLTSPGNVGPSATSPSAAGASSSTYRYNIFETLDSTAINGLCKCFSQIRRSCSRDPANAQKEYYTGFGANSQEDNIHFNSEIGRMIYTISILMMFAFVILMLMIRSIRRSNSTMEVETLLESMRFREDLDLQQRQRRRLQKAKRKVTAWLSKTNGKMFTDGPQILPPRRQHSLVQNVRLKLQQTDRTNSIQSAGSYLPEIVISNSDDNAGGLAAGHGLNPHGSNQRQNSCTPSLSLIYDFEIASKNSKTGATEGSEADLSQLSDASLHSQCLPPLAAAQPGRNQVAPFGFECDTSSVVLLQDCEHSHYRHNQQQQLGYYNSDVAGINNINNNNDSEDGFDVNNKFCNHNYYVPDGFNYYNDQLYYSGSAHSPEPQPRALRSVSVVAAAHAQMMRRVRRDAAARNTPPAAATDRRDSTVPSEAGWY